MVLLSGFLSLDQLSGAVLVCPLLLNRSNFRGGGGLRRAKKCCSSVVPSAGILPGLHQTLLYAADDQREDAVAPAASAAMSEVASSRRWMQCDPGRKALEPFGCGSKLCAPDEHQNRWQMDVHPPQHGANSVGISFNRLIHSVD